MKIISLFVLFVTLGVFADAQEAKVVTELMARSERSVKNAPFSADAVSESVQTLADGNRIVRSSTSKLYRNSEGAFRREITGGSGGMLGSLYTYSHGVTLFDPVAGFRYTIDPNAKTARQILVSPRSEVKVVTPEAAIVEGKLKDEMRAAAAAGKIQAGSVVSDKIKDEIRAVVERAPTIAAQALTSPVLTGGITGVGMGYSTGMSSKWETRTEQLGVQNIEGVNAEGTRTITTIPAGAIGNERPIEITYEKWYSSELQLVVYSKHSDPRFGEQTYRLTNIIRAEPDPSLFTPPQGYRVITEPTSSRTYTINARNAAVAEKASKATTVSKTKP